MIQIPEPPAVHACAGCASSLTWLWSARKGAWVAFVPDPTDGAVLRVHGCRHAQDPPTWRRLPHGQPPNEEYLTAKATLPKLSAVPRTEESLHG